MYRKILLAYDGSVEGRLALREGAMLAKLCKAEVLLLAVVDLSTGILIAEGSIPGTAQQQREAFETVLEEGVRRLEDLGFSPEARLEFGQPAQAIATVARQISADLVVVGHRHHSALSRWWGGSVGSSLLADLSCSLLIALKETGEADDRPENTPQDVSQPGR